MQDMPHLIVVLPGILGSVLAKDGKDIWAPTPGAFFQGILSLGSSLKSLELRRDSSSDDDLGDGVTAPRLIPDVHLVPGLVKIDGYRTLCNALRDSFELSDATGDNSRAGNFIEFPYDWRRDNRYTASRLKKVVEAGLKRLRALTGNADAKVILIAHSMGGLVSRYYLECLGGWQDCLALISFGTPYRGSLNALNYLSNGYRTFGIEVSGLLRSCTSVYQLLPIYKCVQWQGDWYRVAELSCIPGLDQTRAIDALHFHREIEQAARENPRNYRVLPFAGISQPTMQSAHFDGTTLSVDSSIPLGVLDVLAGGDGTVPRVSATPIEASESLLETFHAELHSSLQNNPIILDDLIARLQQMVGAASLASIRGVLPGTVKPSLSLVAPDVVTTAEPITVKLGLSGGRDHDYAVEVIVLHRNSGHSTRYPATLRDGAWEANLPPQAAGEYQLTGQTLPRLAAPVHDVFEVVSNAIREI